jgi:phosphopentomutase
MSTLGVPLLVDECAVVADNVEALRGMSINVTASLASVDFDELLAIGRLVRQVVEVPRVIVLAGRGFDVATMRGHLVETSPGQVGINTPGLGLYDENYRVRQLGARGNNETDLTSLVRDEGGSVVLLGKAADVIECEGAEKEPLVQTAQVLERALEHLVEMKTGLVVANVQETDLAGHEQDALRFGKVLVEADAFLAPIVRALGPDDMLIVTADHGNDPLSGNSQHTREAVPLLLAGARIQVGSFGERRSLADVGSTIGRFLSLPSLVEGTSLGEEVVRCS